MAFHGVAGQSVGAFFVFISQPVVLHRRRSCACTADAQKGLNIMSHNSALTAEATTFTTAPVSAADRILQAALQLKAASEAAAKQVERDRQEFEGLRVQLRERHAAGRAMSETIACAHKEAETLRLSVEYIQQALEVPGEHVEGGRELLAEAQAKLDAVMDEADKLAEQGPENTAAIDAIGAQLRAFSTKPSIQTVLREEQRQAQARVSQESERREALRQARRAPTALERFLGLAALQRQYGGSELTSEIEIVAGAVMGESRTAASKAPEAATKALRSLAEVHASLDPSCPVRTQVFGLFATIASAQGYYVSRRGLPLAAAEVSQGHAIVVASAGERGLEVGASVDPRGFRKSDPRERPARPVDPRLAPLAETFKRQEQRAAAESAVASEPEAMAAAPAAHDGDAIDDSAVGPALDRRSGQIVEAVSDEAVVSEADLAEDVAKAIENRLGDEELQTAESALREHFGCPLPESKPEIQKPKRAEYRGLSAAAMDTVARELVEERAKALRKTLRGVKHTLSVNDLSVMLGGWNAVDVAELVSRAAEQAGPAALDIETLLAVAGALRPDWRPGAVELPAPAPAAQAKPRAREARAAVEAAEAAAVAA